MLNFKKFHSTIPVVHSIVYTLPYEDALLKFQDRARLKGYLLKWSRAKFLLGSGECINSGMEYWNGGMKLFKVQYHFLHPNKYNSSTYVSK